MSDQNEADETFTQEELAAAAEVEQADLQRVQTQYLEQRVVYLRMRVNQLEQELLSYHAEEDEESRTD